MILGINRLILKKDVLATNVHGLLRLSPNLTLSSEIHKADLDNDRGKASGVNIQLATKMSKFEYVVRYTLLKTRDFEIDTDELFRRAPVVGVARGDSDNTYSAFYLGTSYHFSKATKFMLGYESAVAENDDASDKNEVDGIRARLQLLW